MKIFSNDTGEGKMSTKKFQKTVASAVMALGLAVILQLASGCAVGRHFEQRWEKAALESTDVYKASKLLAEYQASGQEGQIRLVVKREGSGDDGSHHATDGDSRRANQLPLMLASNDPAAGETSRHLGMGSMNDVSYQTVAYGKAGDGTWQPLEKLALLETVCRVNDGKLDCFTCTKFSGCVVPAR
jgi:hypothetical protein